MENLIHIIFDQQGGDHLGKSFALDDIIAGEVVLLGDDLAFGPLKTGPVEPGVITRQDWWNKTAGEEPYSKINEDTERLRDLCGLMRSDPASEIWIWIAQNARDVTGYYSLLEPLSDFLGRVHLIFLNNLPFINEKGSIFYPLYLGEILPREFLKARKLARELTAAEIEIDGEEWSRLKEDNAVVRVLEGGKKIRSETGDFFDKELINRCRFEFSKGWRLVNQVHQKCADHINDEFIYGRLATLIENGTLETKGEYKNLRDAEVKAAGSESADENILDQNDESTHESQKP